MCLNKCKEIINILQSKSFTEECIEKSEEIYDYINSINLLTNRLSEAIRLKYQPYYMGECELNAKNYNLYCDAFCKEYGLKAKKEKMPDGSNYYTFRVKGTEVCVVLIYEDYEGIISPTPEIYAHVGHDVTMNIYGFVDLYYLFEEIANGTVNKYISS